MKTSFALRGRFLQYQVNKKFKIKGMHLATAQGEVYIKLPKELRYSSMQILHSGAWVQVQGYQKHDFKTGETQYKALTIVPTGPCHPLPEQALGQSCPDLQVVPDTSSVTPKQKSKGKIRVCEKSSCRKRGSKAVTKALSQSLKQADLGNQVEILGMGCIGKCKAGPNILVLPDKAKYARVKPRQAVEIIQSHFAPKPSPADQIQQTGTTATRNHIDASELVPATLTP